MAGRADLGRRLGAGAFHPSGRRPRGSCRQAWRRDRRQGARGRRISRTVVAPAGSGARWQAASATSCLRGTPVAFQRRPSGSVGPPGPGATARDWPVDGGRPSGRSLDRRACSGTAFPALAGLAAEPLPPSGWPAGRSGWVRGAGEPGRLTWCADRRAGSAKAIGLNDRQAPPAGAVGGRRRSAAGAGHLCQSTPSPLAEHPVPGRPETREDDLKGAAGEARDRGGREGRDGRARQKQDKCGASAGAPGRRRSEAGCPGRD